MLGVILLNPLTNFKQQIIIHIFLVSSQSWERIKWLSQGQLAYNC